LGWHFCLILKMENFEYLRKFSHGIDHGRYDYILEDYFTYLTIRHGTIPTYRLFGGKNHPTRSKIAVEVVSYGAHALMMTPLSLGVIVWASIDMYKNKRVK